MLSSTCLGVHRRAFVAERSQRTHQIPFFHKTLEGGEREKRLQSQPLFLLWKSKEMKEGECKILQSKSRQEGVFWFNKEEVELY